MRTIGLVVIHCADTPNGKHFTTKDIDDWHKERGFQRGDEARKAFNPSLTSIGYHFVIYVDGSLHTGRSIAEIGAHVEGWNSHSVGICLIGKDKFTAEQWATLQELLTSLEDQYPDIKIKGHYQIANGRKDCPNFYVPIYIADNLVPTEDHIWSV